MGTDFRLRHRNYQTDRRTIIIRFWRVQGDEKADGSLVTQSDRWADAEIRSAINQTFPTHGVLSEEGSHLFTNDEWVWISILSMVRPTLHAGFHSGGFQWGYYIGEILSLLRSFSTDKSKFFTAIGAAIQI